MNTAHAIDRYEAEIVPHCDPAWHVVVTLPAHDNVAAAHLVSRRFGIYQPTIEQRIPATERVKAHKRRVAMFPGYLFLFVWDIMDHWRRIRACPGVSHIVMQADRPAVIPDEFISRVQLEECGLSIDVFDVIRRRRRRRREPETQPHEPTLISISTRSHWRNLDEPARLSVLRMALGLPSQH